MGFKWTPNMLHVLGETSVNTGFPSIKLCVDSRRCAVPRINHVPRQRAVESCEITDVKWKDGRDMG
jgi:hypothetical protein